jgi:hypothetical protein
VFLKAPQVRLEQAKGSFGIPRIHPGSPQADYAAFLLLYDAPPFGDKLLGAAKIVFGIHLSNNAQAAKQGRRIHLCRHPRAACAMHTVVGEDQNESYKERRPRCQNKKAPRWFGGTLRKRMKRDHKVLPRSGLVNAGDSGPRGTFWQSANFNRERATSWL